MIEIIEPNKITFQILGNQKIDVDCNYRFIKYHHVCSVRGGILMMNFLTSEMIFLDEDDEKDLKRDELTSLKELLISKWFLVPLDNDDLTLYLQLDSTRNIIYSNITNNSGNNAITSYTILPTTDCNARCFYCFELGRKRTFMSKKTALDVADYIIAHSCGNKVKLRWFGGEPLYNVEAIDLICNRLKDNNIKYVSNMISNGYLFDKEIVTKAKSLWNLNNIQITLDGTEKIYNQIKAYIYQDDNPFLRVSQNIEMLLNAGFNIHVRINMDFHNESDLYNLVDYLFERFNSFNNFTVYAHLLFENEHSNCRNADEKKELVKRFIALEDYMHEKKLFRYSLLTNAYREAGCMASKDNTTVVMTDGKLGKCEYYTDSNAWGDIYSNEINYEMIKKYKIPRKYFPQCDECAYRPFCHQISECPHAIKDCDETDRLMTFMHFEKYMKATYEKYLTGTNDNISIF